MGGYAWVTLATNDSYSLGALVVANSLKRVGTKHDSVVLITPGVTPLMREKLAAAFSLVQEVNVLDSKDQANLALLARPELGVTFTKLHCWKLTQFDKCVFIDADTLIVRNCDELFEREELSAAPDVGWPDCFNSGVFVFKPSLETFESITKFAVEKGSFDGGDQGLLNMYFHDWAWKDIDKHLPFIYNMCSTATYSYLPAFKQFGEDVKIIHFIGATKPWLQYFDTMTGIVQPPRNCAHLQPLLQLWWNIFCDLVHPQLSPNMATSTLAPIWHKFTPTFHSQNNPSHCDKDYKDYNEMPPAAPPDFSEFKDPWEDFSVKTDDNCNLKNFSKQHSVTATHEQSHNFYENKCYVHYEDRCSEQNKHKAINNENKNFSDQSSYGSPSESISYRQETCRIQQHQPEHQPEHQPKHQPEHQPKHQPEHFSESQDSADTRRDQRQEWKHQETQHKSQYEQHPVHTYERTQDKSHSSHKDERIETQNQYQYQCVCIDKPIESDKAAREVEQSSQEDKQHKSETQESSDSSKISYLEETKKENFHERKEQHSHSQVNFVHRPTHSPTESQPSPINSCTELHNVAPQTDLIITGHPNRSNAGLAGALAQITLGQPRSAEQIAFEEHMRKQSWEQGQIDFMGRDSFDNIWKKICETLSQAPQRQTTPPKESVESEIIDITKETALLSLESQPVQKAEEEPLPSEKISESVTEQRVPAEVTESKPVDSKDVVNPILAAIQANVDQLCTELASNLIERAVPEQGTPEKFDVANKSTEPPAGDIDICSLPAASTDRIIKDLQEESDKCQLSVINPVPIQVAESVLQTEPKESVSEVPKPVEQVISSSVDIVQEAVVTRAEILAQATGLAPSSDLENGGLEEGQAVAPLLPETRRVSLKSDSLPKEQLEDAQLINIPAESVDQEAEKRETQVPLQEIKSENLPQDLEVKPVEIGPEVPKIQELKPEVSDQKLVESKEIVLDVTEKELKVEAAPDQKLESKDSQSEVVVQKSESKDSQSEIVDQKAESKELVPEAMEKELKSEIVVEKSESKELKPEEPIIEKDLKSEVSEQKTESKESVPEAVTEQKTEPKESVPEVVTEQKTESKESIPEVVTEQTLKSEISDQTSKSKEPAVAEVLEQKLESGIQEQQKSESKELAVDVAATQELKLEEEDASKKLETKPKDLALEIPTRTLEKTTEEAVVAGEVSTGKEESVEAPIAAKELDIPPTPTVTEATPPTSPPIQQEDIEKVSKKTTKKVIKKTSSEDTADTAEAEGGESSGKKGTKKVVKKVVKRKDSDEGQESEKTKKSVKATKKVTKPAQALGPDTNVPETPPPSSSSEVPVPPKRKAKGSTTKSSKPDSES